MTYKIRELYKVTTTYTQTVVVYATDREDAVEASKVDFSEYGCPPTVSGREVVPYDNSSGEWDEKDYRPFVSSGADGIGGPWNEDDTISDIKEFQRACYVVVDELDEYGDYVTVEGHGPMAEKEAVLLAGELKEKIDPLDENDRGVWVRKGAGNA